MKEGSRYDASLQAWKEQNRLRSLRSRETAGAYILTGERRMLNLSSNDYLGIGSSETLWKEFLTHEASRKPEDTRFSGGSTSSRLLTGNDPAYTHIEQWLTRAFRREAALVLNSGYHANLGILPALTTRRDLILADKLVHASIIDGIRLSSAACMRYPHNNLGKLTEILRKVRHQYDQVFIVTESLFSMDGDYADLKELVRLKKECNAMLYVDEAHSFGATGAGGLGSAADQGVACDIDLLVGTFGKAIASQGAFVATSQTIVDYLVNTMRPLLFSTALPPWSLRWTLFVLERLPEMNRERAHLALLSKRLQLGLRELGLEVSGNSHIVPLYLRDLEKTVALASALQEHGFFVLPIRPPTVPEGTERLRISLTAAHTPEHIDSFIRACRPIG